MKARTRILLTGAVAGGALLSAAASQAGETCEGRAGGGAVKLAIEVAGVGAARGEVAVTVYPDDPRRFLAPGGKLVRIRTPASAPVTRACFWLPAGAYGVAVYHDRNANRDFDRDATGRPVEGYGYSNNAPVRMALPSFASVRFQLPPSGGAITVRMRYP